MVEREELTNSACKRTYCWNKRKNLHCLPLNLQFERGKELAVSGGCVFISMDKYIFLYKVNGINKKREKLPYTRGIPKGRKSVSKHDSLQKRISDWRGKKPRHYSFPSSLTSLLS